MLTSPSKLDFIHWAAKLATLNHAGQILRPNG